MEILQLTPAERDTLVDLRSNLWPDSADAHRAELDYLFTDPDYCAFMAWDSARPVGFAEALIRAYVPGGATPDTAFLEGLWVAPDCRRQGIATALLRAAEGWAASHGCGEIGSDALLDNTISHAWHHRMGFAEVERTISYIRRLPS